MSEVLPGDVQVVRARADRTGQPHTVPQVDSRLDFKVLTAETGGSLFVLENRDMVRGGPPRHVHPAQDEWFFLIEGGELALEIGDRAVRLTPGDSVLAPRNVPHVWAYLGDTPGRMVVAFTPAGAMEAFFAETSRPGAVADPKVFEAHGMRVVGPPLRI